MIAKKQDIRERSFDFALITIKNCKRIKENFREFILTDQLVRSSTSVGANMREARNAESKADFIHKLSICQKECDESIYWLELLMALLDEEKEYLLPIHDEANQLLRIIKTISLRTKESSNWRKR
ncbi:MAG: four helix bundle protein [Fluviicola sp.]